MEENIMYINPIIKIEIDNYFLIENINEHFQNVFLDIDSKYAKKIKCVSYSFFHTETMIPLTILICLSNPYVIDNYLYIPINVFDGVKFTLEETKCVFSLGNDIMDTRVNIFNCCAENFMQMINTDLTNNEIKYEITFERIINDCINTHNFISRRIKYMITNKNKEILHINTGDNIEYLMAAKQTKYYNIFDWSNVHDFKKIIDFIDVKNIILMWKYEEIDINLTIP